MRRDYDDDYDRIESPGIIPDQEPPASKKRSEQNDIITEDSAAVAFVAQHGDKVRYCHSTGSWFKWDGNIWRKDDKHLAFHWARILIRQLVQDHNAKVRGIASKVSFCGGVEKFSQRDPVVAVTIENWDHDEWLLGTPAGTIDLKTGKLRPSEPRDGITKTTLVAPDNSGCPQWLKFLNEATNGDQELIRFLQQWLGYSLTGSIREHAFIFVYGPGGNGKGVFLNVTSKILGDYATTAAMDTFTASKNDRHPTDLAKLRGARIVTASETEHGHAWAEARIKALTGGDEISARFMRQDFFEYKPQFKLTVIGNHKPFIRNVDDAMRRRVNIIPFVHKPAVVDHDLENKIIIEAPGILQWMVQGCLDWQANGLIRPEIVQAATADYFSDQDLFGQWIEDCCDVLVGAIPPIWDYASDLFASWSEYAKKAGEEPGSQKAFASELGKRGFERDRTRKGRTFKGIRVKSKPLSEAMGAFKPDEG
jgi:putative DNA primase/helicase